LTRSPAPASSRCKSHRSAGRLPFGVYTGFLTAIALLAVTVTDFAGASGVAAAVAGLLTDGLSLLAVRMRLSGRTRVLATAVVVPVLLSSAQLVAVQLRLGVRWSAELVGGVVAMSALVSVAVVGVLGWSGQVGEGDRG